MYVTEIPLICLTDSYLRPVSKNLENNKCVYLLNSIYCRCSAVSWVVDGITCHGLIHDTVIHRKATSVTKSIYPHNHFGCKHASQPIMSRQHKYLLTKTASEQTMVGFSRATDFHKWKNHDLDRGLILVQNTSLINFLWRSSAVFSLPIHVYLLFICATRQTVLFEQCFL